MRLRRRDYRWHCRDIVRRWEREVATREGLPFERAARVLVVSHRILGEAEARAWGPQGRAAKDDETVMRAILTEPEGPLA